MSNNIENAPRAGSESPAAMEQDSKMIEQRAHDFEARLHTLGFKRENVTMNELQRDAEELFSKLGRRTSH